MSPRRVPAWQGSVKPMLCFFLLSGFVSCFKDFYLVTEPKTFNEARACCRKKYTDVASINSQQQMDEVLEVAAEAGYEGEVWIGRRDFGGWIWDLQGGSFKNWSEGEPDATGFTLCAGMYQDTGAWFDFNCGSMDLPFVCFDDAIDPNLTTYAPDRYLYVNLTDVSPNTYCFQNYYSGVVAVRNAFENELIRQMLPPGTTTLLGMSRSFFAWWSDDSYPGYSNWAEGQPQHNGSCSTSVIGGDPSGQWVAKPCGERHHFMCYSDKTTVWMVGLKAVTSTADLNDPAVTAAILADIGVKMKAGLEDKFRVYWNTKTGGRIFFQTDEPRRSVEVPSASSFALPEFCTANEFM